MVDGVSSSAAQATDSSQWHLPTSDLRNEGKYMYRIHTIDIYFWTKEDTLLFLESAQKFLPDHQLRISDAPAALQEHRNSMSPVVQKLENAAITSKIAQRSNSVSTTNSGNVGLTFPGPPTSASPALTGPTADSNYAPIAYNPAAPAAPEPIAHREKTPPPIDAVTGTGLQAAVSHDQGYHPGYGPPQQPYQQSAGGYMPGPPGLPPQPGIQRANTSHSLPPPPGPPGASAGPSPYQPGPPAASHTPDANPNAKWMPQPGNLQRQSTTPAGYQGYGSASSTPQPPAPAQTQYANYPSAPSFGPPPVQSPGYTPGVGRGFSGPPQQASITPPPPPQQPQPLGGYSNFSYGAPAQHTQGQAAGYDIHAHVYRPTESELKHGAKEAKPNPNSTANPGKLEQKMGKVENKFGRFLKKLDDKM